MPPLTIACRVASYGDYQDKAWAHLPSIGITNVEVPVPAASEYDALRNRLADHGLTVTTFQGKCDIAQADAVDVMRPQIDACAAFGVPICFLSVKAGEADRKEVYVRLRQIGALAAEQNITIALETHPDLVTNGVLGAETMAAVNHPNVTINFDTANVYFYNEGATADGELVKMIDHVGAVHLKDTNGGYKEWHFPVLGTGVVDFPKVFEMMGERGFTGPYTMELEGIEGVEMDEAARLQYIADSVAYLRKLGMLGT